MKIISVKNYILYAFKWVKIRVKTSRNVHQDNANHKTRSSINSTPHFLMKTSVKQFND